MDGPGDWRGDADRRSERGGASSSMSRGADLRWVPSHGTGGMAALDGDGLAGPAGDELVVSAASSLARSYLILWTQFTSRVTFTSVNSDSAIQSGVQNAIK